MSGSPIFGGWRRPGHCSDISGPCAFLYPINRTRTAGLTAATSVLAYFDRINEARSLHTRVKHQGAYPIAERRHDRAVGAAAKAGKGTLAALLYLYAERRGGELKRWVKPSVCKGGVQAPSPPATRGAGGSGFPNAGDGYKAQHAGGAAVRYVRPILKWGATRGYLAPEVAAIHLPAPVRRRKRVLTRD